MVGTEKKIQNVPPSTDCFNDPSEKAPQLWKGKTAQANWSKNRGGKGGVGHNSRGGETSEKRWRKNLGEKGERWVKKKKNNLWGGVGGGGSLQLKTAAAVTTLEVGRGESIEAGGITNPTGGESCKRETKKRPRMRRRNKKMGTVLYWKEKKGLKPGRKWGPQGKREQAWVPGSDGG